MDIAMLPIVFALEFTLATALAAATEGLDWNRYTGKLYNYTNAHSFIHL